MAISLENDDNFSPPVDLLRIAAASRESFRLTSDLVLKLAGDEAFNFLLKSQARLISDLARENCGPQAAREILDEIAAGS